MNVADAVFKRFVPQKIKHRIVARLDITLFPILSNDPGRACQPRSTVNKSPSSTEPTRARFPAKRPLTSRASNPTVTARATTAQRTWRKQNQSWSSRHPQQRRVGPTALLHHGKLIHLGDVGFHFAAHAAETKPSHTKPRRARRGWPTHFLSNPPVCFHQMPNCSKTPRVVAVRVRNTTSSIRAGHRRRSRSTPIQRHGETWRDCESWMRREGIEDFVEWRELGSKSAKHHSVASTITASQNQIILRWAAEKRFWPRNDCTAAQAAMTSTNMPA